MTISAKVSNRGGEHRTVVRTGSSEQQLSIPAKTEGSGSAINGGELLFLALATCYCNDLYREARLRNIAVSSVEVEVTGHFDGPGEPAKDIRYTAAVRSSGRRDDVLALMRHTDTVAEIHNTLRLGMPVVLAACEALPEDEAS